MSYVVVSADAIAATASQMAGIGSSLHAAYVAAAASTTSHG